MKVSIHFNLAEFACKDGTPYPTQWMTSRLMPLVQDLEEIRKACGEPILITSGYRTPQYNKKIGGALLSQHTQGRAVDIKCLNANVKELYVTIIQLIRNGKIKDGGVGLYRSWVHYDHGSSRRWKG